MLKWILKNKIIIQHSSAEPEKGTTTTQNKNKIFQRNFVIFFHTSFEKSFGVVVVVAAAALTLWLSSGFVVLCVFLFPVLLFCHSCPAEEEERSMCVCKSRRKMRRRRRGREKKNNINTVLPSQLYTLVVKERAKKLTGL